jgi:uncharacterized protein
MKALAALSRHKIVLGMVHLQPLPGTPFYVEGSLAKIAETATQSAAALHDGGADGCLVQTVDRLYGVADESDPARTVAMGLIVNAIRQRVGPEFCIGVQLMRNAVKASLAVAKVCDGTFVRAGVFVGAALTEYGLVEAHPLDVIEYRHKINALDIDLIADVELTQYKWLGNPKPPGEMARAAARMGATAVAIGHPDEATTVEAIISVRKAAPDLPIILAGYTHHENVARLLALADGAFVGSCFESRGWGTTVERDRVAAYVEIVRRTEEQFSG